MTIHIVTDKQAYKTVVPAVVLFGFIDRTLRIDLLLVFICKHACYQMFVIIILYNTSQSVSRVAVLVMAM